MLNLDCAAGTVITRHPQLSYFSKIITPQLAKFLNSTSMLTLFLPVDEAWQALDHYERLYLESEFAADDLKRILNMHAVLLDEVKWADSFTEEAVKRKPRVMARRQRPLTVAPQSLPSMAPSSALCQRRIATRSRCPTQIS